MNAPVLNLVGATDPCARCGSQRQYHREPGHICRDFLALPSASAWHQTDAVRRIVSDMHMLSRIAEVVNLHYAKAEDYSLRGVADPIGVLQVTGRWDQPKRYAAEGVVGDLLNALDTARSDAVTAAVRRTFPASCRSQSDEFDEFSDMLDAHFDSVAQAVEAAR